MAIKYEFKYMPLVGKLPGKSMAEQTEQAINEIAEIVNDNVAQAEIINKLAEEANANSVEALEKATEALETSGRVYVMEDTAVDLDNFCESQLLYINNIASTNLPEALKKGFLEVKTNEDKTEAAQFYTTDEGNLYRRLGTITAQQVGDVTYYVASYGSWEQIATDSVLADYAPLDSPAFTGTPTAPTPTVTDDSTKIATTEFVHDVCVPVDIDETANSGNYYSYSVPSGKVFSNFSQIGGKTIAWNQLCGSNTLPTGVTYQNNGNYLINATFSGAVYPTLSVIKTVVGHKYYISIDTTTTTANAISLFNDSNGLVVNNSNGGHGATIGTATGAALIYLAIPAGTYNVTAKCRCIDLTLAFGSGNEPTTTAEVESMFPSYYEYNEGTLLSAGVTEVKSVGKNLANPNDITYTPDFTYSNGSYSNVLTDGRTGIVTVVQLYNGNTFVSSPVATLVGDRRISVISESTRITRIVFGHSGSNRDLKLRLNVDIPAGETYTFSFYQPYDNPSVVGGLVINNIMLEKGSTASTYEPYKGVVMPIPSAIQSLDGYGWSAGSVKNEVDFVNKKFIKRVGSVDLGSFTWSSYGNRFSTTTTINAKTVGDSAVGNMICPIYVSISYANRDSIDKSVYLFNDNGMKVGVHDSAYSDATTFKTAMSGVYLYYELATPIETDISAILGASGIATSSGGTLIFANVNGDNYRLPVPVSQELIDGTDGLMTVQDKAKLDTCYNALQADNSGHSYETETYILNGITALVMRRDNVIIIRISGVVTTVFNVVANYIIPANTSKILSKAIRLNVDDTTVTVLNGTRYTVTFLANDSSLRIHPRGGGILVDDVLASELVLFVE